MRQADVFFTDFHATPRETLPQKLHRLMKRAGFETIDFADHYAAIKIHFGELGNLAHLISLICDVSPFSSPQAGSESRRISRS